MIGTVFCALNKWALIGGQLRLLGAQLGSLVDAWGRPIVMVCHDSHKLCVLQTIDRELYLPLVLVDPCLNARLGVCLFAMKGMTNCQPTPNHSICEEFQLMAWKLWTLLEKFRVK